MPPTGAVPGILATLKVGDGASPESFTAISEITNLAGPEISADEIEVTNLDSPNAFKEYISGPKEGGNVTGTMNWNKTAKQVQVRDDVASGMKRNYELTWPTSPETKFAFVGLPTSFTGTADPGSAVTADFGLRVDGAGSWS